MIHSRSGYFYGLRKRLKHNHAVTPSRVNEDGRSTTIIVDFADAEAAGGSTRYHTNIEKIVAPERDAQTDFVATGTLAMIYWYLAYAQPETEVRVGK